MDEICLLITINIIYSFQFVIFIVFFACPPKVIIYRVDWSKVSYILRMMETMEFSICSTGCCYRKWWPGKSVATMIWYCFNDSNKNPNVVSNKMHRTSKYKVRWCCNWDYVSENIFDWVSIFRGERHFFNYRMINFFTCYIKFMVNLMNSFIKMFCMK